MTEGLKSVEWDGKWRVKFDKTRVEAGLLDEIRRAVADGRRVGSWTRIAGSSNSRVWKFDCGGKEYVLKEFLSRSPLEAIKSVVRGTRAEKAWKGGRMIEQAGFLTPQLIAYGVKKGALGESFMVTGYLCGAVCVADLLSGRAAEFKGKRLAEARRLVMEGLGGTVGSMHAKGVVHGDLRLGNIFALFDDGGVSFSFMDNERNAVYSKVPEKLIRKNLVQTNMISLEFVSLAERMRFFKAYAKACPGARAGGKELIRAVCKKTAERLKGKGL